MHLKTILLIAKLAKLVKPAKKQQNPTKGKKKKNTWINIKLLVRKIKPQNGQL